MKYAYEDLGNDQFEQLIVLLCRRLLGMGTQGFAKGVDGGRDAKFVGTAEQIPSRAAPWIGTVIVQAKHTSGQNRSFSETDFLNFKSNNTIIGKEVPRITKLRMNKQLDHYMLFANRRLTGNTESAIRTHIHEACGVPEASIMLCGFEQIEGWLKEFPEVGSLAKLDPLDSPLIVSPDELSEVVQALARQIGKLGADTDMPPVKRTAYETKNEINNMSVDFAKHLVKQYLKETTLIKRFLASPENEQLLHMYESAVEEFQLKIIAKRKNHHTFDEVYVHLLDILFGRDPLLRANKRLTRVIVFYMYWNCDIGQSEYAETI